MAGEGEGVEAITDVLFDILVRLPPKSVYKFRIVSNRWNDMVTSPYFHKLYNVRLKHKFRLRAFIQTPPPHFDEDEDMYLIPEPKMNILSVCFPFSLDKDNCKKLVDSIKYYGTFIACSNGLVLTGEHYRNRYSVLNLVTKQCVSLPPLRKRIFEELNMALFYEEKEEGFVPNYKIIAAPRYHGNVFTIQIYSSNTRKWTKSIMKVVDNYFKIKNDKPPVVVNGFIHWYSTFSWCLVVMDTKELIVDGGENHIQLIRLPIVNGFVNEFRYNVPENFSFTRSSSGDLWFCSRHEQDEVIRFWTLPESESVNRCNATISNTKWILINTIYLNSHRKEMALSLRNKYYPVYNKKKANEDVIHQIESGNITVETLLPWKKTMYVVIRVKPLGRHPQGPHLDRIYLYNLVKKSYKWVNYSSIYDPISASGLYPYMDPFTLSSYGNLGTS